MTRVSLIQSSNTKRTTKNHARVSKKCFVCGKGIVVPKAKKNPGAAMNSSHEKQLQPPVKYGFVGFGDQSPLPNGEINATTKLLGYEK